MKGERAIPPTTEASGSPCPLLITMMIFATEKDYRSWRRQKGLEHEKDRVSYRKSDGTFFYDPRYGEMLKLRHERTWRNPRTAQKRLSHDFGWRAEKYELFGSVDEENELRDEYQREIDFQKWQQEMQRYEAEQKKIAEEQAEMWRGMYPVENFFEDINGYTGQLSAMSGETLPFYPPVCDAEKRKVFIFITNVDEMEYLDIARKYENYGFKINMMPEAFAYAVAVSLP